jgi:Domain of unknown function (DUF4214)/Right handed beta helix region
VIQMRTHFLLLTLLAVLSFSISACSGFSSTSNSEQETIGSRLYSSSRATQTPACDTLFALFPKGVDVYKPLQECIDSIPDGGELALLPGVYNLHTSVHVRKPITLTTVGNPVCSTSENHQCAELRALPNAETEFVIGLLGVSGNGAVVRNIVVNGNRLNRMQSSYADLCRKGDNIAQNMQVEGNNITITEVVVKNALCAAGLGVMKGSSNLTVSKNIIASNGTHDQDGLWADGLTVIEASNSRFIDNQFYDNTDVDAVFGGCPNCVIQGNKFSHSEAFSGSSFAVLQLHAWPGTTSGTSGDYTGSDISNNTIDCGLKRRCGFGLILGGEPWYSSPLQGGFFHDNRINNALNGFLVEKASATIRIKDNVVSASGGQTLTNAGIRTGLAYNIPDTANVVIEDSIISRSAYASQSFSRAIANWWTQDTAWSTTPSVGADSEAMIREVYRSILGREIDSSGLEYWGQFIKAGHTRDQLFNAISLSAEALIRNAYIDVLKREVDAAGLQYWTTFLQTHTPQEMRTELSKTPEAIVRRIFRELLQREPDQVGLKYYVDKMSNGSTESSIRKEVMASPEYRH